MPELLEKAAREQFFIHENFYAASTRAVYFDSMSTIAPVRLKNKYELMKSEALLYSGETRNAIEVLEVLWEESISTAVMYSLDAHEEEKISDLLALAYLRLGEQENCIHHHASASCIIPIEAAGFHQIPEGSTNAIKFLENILTNNSHDFHSRWLLNIAFMTLGKYPSEVPEKWLIPERVFQSEYPLKKFEEIAPKLGLHVNELSGGGIVDDFNNDYLLDVMVSSWLPTHHLRYFINNGDGTFTEKTETAGLEEVTGD